MVHRSFQQGTRAESPARRRPLTFCRLPVVCADITRTYSADLTSTSSSGIPRRRTRRQVPGGQCQVKHEERADHRKRTHPEAQHQGKADQHFRDPHGVGANFRVIKRLAQNGLIKADRALLHVAGHVFLEAFAGEVLVNEFVLGKHDEHHADGHTRHHHGHRRHSVFHAG